MPFSTKRFAFGLVSAVFALAANSCGGDTELIVPPNTTAATDGGADATALIVPGQTPHVPTTPTQPLTVQMPKKQPGSGAPSANQNPVVLPKVH